MSTRRYDVTVRVEVDDPADGQDPDNEPEMVVKAIRAAKVALALMDTQPEFEPTVKEVLD
jgi:hypothetical protein